jgi:intein/homing endonuclease
MYGNGEIREVTMKNVVEEIKKDKNIKVLSQDNIFRPMLAAAKMKSNAEIIEVSDDELGVKIVCTPDHQILTKNRGYVMAGELNENDELIINK